MLLSILVFGDKVIFAGGGGRAGVFTILGTAISLKTFLRKILVSQKYSFFNYENTSIKS